MPLPDRSALDLLSGDAQTFHHKVWASRVHVHHTDPTELVGLLSLQDVDRLLTSSALRTPALRLAQDGSVIPPSRFTRHATMSGTAVTGLVDGRKVLDLFDGGATVVLQGLHRYHPPLTRLVRRLELELGHPCQANAYLTPPGAQGFARHSDSHDVFVFQTHGHKQWEVVEPDSSGFPDGPAREVLLEPGLSMYLPTGTPHAARSQEVTSLHVTLGINRVSLRELLRSLATRALADERYDVPLPSGWVDDPSLLAAALGEPLAALADSLAALDTTAVADARADAFLSDRSPVLDGGLVDRVALSALSDDTRVERRPTAACVLRPGPERLTVHLGDRSLRMPLRLTPVMEHVRDTPAFAVADLEPWLDASSRLVVVRRLVREGLLRIVP
ncbi:cupin domain-containing protein [Nocardioides iriomotensis]|uniref:Cupin n=1 Tax=Nocardioides iriomotensis TaxID=715784 RepID=A0A4Q5IXY2_9ACTN|nr:cupin domain-containing protein [Nocardioides iriomotensis]RYU11030.1 cupin [Nocardioides iriomotensis]